MSTMTLSPTTLSRTTLGPTYARPAVRGAQGSVRLTRRGRLVVFTLALLVVLGLGTLLGARSVASEHPGTPEPTRVVMVGSGDTLWQIAAGLADDGDVRAMIDRIEELNALDTAMVTAGQRLRVPIVD